jgi:membrane-associated phospholipid phosphatase
MKRLPAHRFYRPNVENGRVEAARPEGEEVPPPEHDPAAEGMADNARAALRTGARVAGRRWRGLLGLFLGILLPLIAFGVLAEDVWEGDGIAWDEPVLRAVHAHASPATDRWMVALTRVGYQWGTVPGAVLLVAWLVYRRRRRDAVFATLAVGGAGVLVTMLKLLFRRVRPDLWVSVAPETDYGFPSGHATLNTALAATLVVLLWRTRWRWPAVAVGIIWVLAVDLSRLYLGVHYPSDVSAGTLGALAWVLGLRNILPRQPDLQVRSASPAPAARARGIRT